MLAPRRQHLLSRGLRRIFRRLTHCFRNRNKTQRSLLPKLRLIGDTLPKLSETVLLGLSLVNLLAGLLTTTCQSAIRQIQIPLRLACQSSKARGNGRIENLYAVVVVASLRCERSRSQEVAEDVANFSGLDDAENQPYLLMGVSCRGSNDPWLTARF